MKKTLSRCMLPILACVALPAFSAHTYEFGACEQQLLWRDGGNLPLQMEHLDAMDQAGAGWIRLSTIVKASSKHKLVAHIKRCNELGIKVLMVLESGQEELYPPGTVKRPGSPTPGQPAWPSYRLSDLDVDRAETYVSDFFTLLASSNATIHAVEMFNEINWYGFNGDLPLVDDGLLIDEGTPWTDPVFSQYRIGVDKVAQLTKRVSDLNDEFFGGAPKIITAGLVGFDTMDTNWMASVDGALVDQQLTLQLMHGSNTNQVGATNYLDYVDGIGMHIYPATVDYNPQTAFDEIAADLDPLLPVPGAGTTKPFWITECGYTKNKCGNSETNRFNQLSVFYNALDSYDRPKSAVGAVFHFCWSEEAYPQHAVWNHGTFYKSADIFKTPGAENTTWSSHLFDAWQVEHFGDQSHLDSVAGDSVDFDGDGSPNLAEYDAGSNPVNPSDPGKVLMIHADPLVVYTSRTNDPQTNCTLQWTEELAPEPDWQTAPASASGEAAPEGFQSFSHHPAGTNGFYRLRIVRTP